MKILNIAYYTILRNLRDKRSLALTLLFPIFLILILGSALSKIYSPGTISKITTAYINEDRGEMGKQFENFLNRKEIKDLLEIKKVASYDDGIKLIKANNAEELIYIPSDYSSNVAVGKKSEIKVYQNINDPVDSSIIRNIIDSFTNGANTMVAIYKMGSIAKGYSSGDMIKDMPMSENGNVPRAIDYYAVTMIGMTLMYGTLYASFGMAEDKYTNTYIRIKSSPTRDYENFIGKTLGTIATLVLEVLIIIGFTKFVYHVNWGTNIPMVIFLSVLFSIFATGLGIFAYSVTNSTTRASALLNILALCLTFVSGGYAKIPYTGSTFDKIVSFVPNKMFQTSVFNTIYGGPVSETHTCIIGLIGITIVLFAISSTVGRRTLN